MSPAIVALLTLVVAVPVGIGAYVSMRRSETPEERRLRELPALTNGRRPR